MKALRRKAWWGSGIMLMALAAWIASRGFASTGGAPTVDSSRKLIPVASDAPATLAPPQPIDTPASPMDRDPLLDSAGDPFQPESFQPPAPTVVAAAPPPPPSPPKPIALAFPYRFFGRMAGVDGLMVTYLSRDDALVPVRVGDVLDSVYRVDAVDDKQINVTYLPLNEKFTLSAPTAQF